MILQKKSLMLTSVGGDGLEVSGLGLDIIDGGPFEVGDDEMESFFEDVIFQASKSAENNSLMTRFNYEKRVREVLKVAEFYL